MIGRRSAEVEEFWQRCRAATGVTADAYHVSSFADPVLSASVDKIGELACSGAKRATAHLLLDFEINAVARRAVGDYWVVVGAAGAPLCVVRVTKVEVLPFDRVGPEFAATEGEGDLSLEYWATVHRRYFEKQCAAWGRDWSADLAVICESFERIWPA